jgi:hypothetical protein
MNGDRLALRIASIGPVQYACPCPEEASIEQRGKEFHGKNSPRGDALVLRDFVAPTKLRGHATSIGALVHLPESDAFCRHAVR